MLSRGRLAGQAAHAPLLFEELSPKPREARRAVVSEGDQDRLVVGPGERRLGRHVQLDRLLELRRRLPEAGVSDDPGEQPCRRCPESKSRDPHGRDRSADRGNVAGRGAAPLVRKGPRCNNPRGGSERGTRPRGGVGHRLWGAARASVASLPLGVPAREPPPK